MELIIVARDDHALLADLSAKFEAVDVRVIADQRSPSAAARPPGVERRARSIDAELSLFGFAFAETSPPGY